MQFNQVAGAWAACALMADVSFVGDELSRQVSLDNRSAATYLRGDTLKKTAVSGRWATRVLCGPRAKFPRPGDA